MPQFPHVQGFQQLFGHQDTGLGHCLVLAGDTMGQGWYLRVGFDFDVVFGHKALAAIQLSLVPVLVIFHVEYLGQESSREASALPPSPWPSTAPV